MEQKYLIWGQRIQSSLTGGLKEEKNGGMVQRYDGNQAIYYIPLISYYRQNISSRGGIRTRKVPLGGKGCT